MRIGLADELHAACGGQGLEAVEHLGGVGLELLYHGAGEGECHLELLAAGGYHLQQELVHGQVAPLGHTAEDGPVGEVIVIVMVVSYIEETVLSETVRLMNLKIYAD